MKWVRRSWLPGAVSDVGSRGGKIVTPPAGFVQLLHVDLLQVVERRACSDRNLRRRVALVVFEVSVDLDLMDPHLLWELDVDEVWLGAVGLPVRVSAVISQLLDAIPRLSSRERPYCLLTDLPPVADFPLLVVAHAGVGHLRPPPAKRGKREEGKRALGRVKVFPPTPSTIRK
eukprot:CAMPEP_0181181820 /NCGR_PEP_ID=MMETSP1096-20121128/7544_1 /TAXON_ID=156174 ORGANISM="Chrysochromulina ericina, Strain CCMP281" /NCGR_SAMPLE_ID=MMETSP1096 /ASSEMBLY_ACC=CAM_ASM_000453 /LENGTH=172 /DNA_ID=CAMNT_0023270355 /DNA_START=396 /DNA_END=910 /DNA_ORIENTATION=+